MKYVTLGDRHGKVLIVRPFGNLLGKGVSGVLDKVCVDFRSQ